MNLKTLEDKNVLILGFGREGRDSLRFLRKIFPNKVLGVGDINENVKCQMSNVKKVRWHLGENYLRAIKNYDVIIKSPGIPPAKIFTAQKPRRASQIITSQTDIFLENCPGKIIGITGTKGKSTTAALIYNIFKKGGFKAHLVGNIGKPVLSALFSTTPKDIYVYELSSFQLQNIRKSPEIAILLNIYPEHLDYHKNFKEYVRSKANVTRYQTKSDYLIFDSQNRLVREIAWGSKAKKISIPTNYELVTNIRIKNKPPLTGKFNLQNVNAAIIVGKIFGISNKDIARTIKDFKTLPHRLEFVGNYKEIKFYNDSLSTIPETTILAIESLGDSVQTIILGGFDRGQDFENLAKKILKSEIKNVILFPTTGQRIWKEIEKPRTRTPKENKFPTGQASSVRGRLKSKTLPSHFFVNNMREAVKIVYQFTQKGKICLLSPASASFGLFRDYKERGNLFKKLIKKLARCELKNQIIFY